VIIVLLGALLGGALTLAFLLKRRWTRSESVAALNIELADQFRELALQLHVGYASLARDARACGLEQPTLPSDAELDVLVDRFQALSKRGGWMS